MERQQGKAEGGNFCVVGHFQFTRFDLQVFVVVLNQIMFEFHKWLERESLFVLHFTTEIYGYSANIKQPEQRNKPKNITAYYPPQQTLVSRKPQQQQAERSGGLHSYMITQNQNMKTQRPQQTSSQRHNKHKNKPTTTHHRQKCGAVCLSIAETHQAAASHIRSTSQYKTFPGAHLRWSAEKSSQLGEN